jgi:NADH dehydrogenase
MGQGMARTIAVLGAGFGGLRAAILLARGLRGRQFQDCRVVLVDRNDYLTYSPLLYELSASPPQIADHFDLPSLVAFPLDAGLLHYPVERLRDTVSGLDLPNGSVSLASGTGLSYDALIVALGAEPDTDRIPGLKEAALELKTFADAVRIRDAIWLAGCSMKRLSIVIGGAGATGVELAFELQPWLNEITEAGRCRTGITLVQAGGGVLGGFPRHMAHRLAMRLAALGVKVLTDERIAAIDAGTHRLELESGMLIPFDILVWAGGVKPSSVLRGLPVRYAGDGRLAVGADLALLPAADASLPGKVYGVGDAISAPGEAAAVALTIPRALAQATLVASNVIADLAGGSGIAYRPPPAPYVIAVGGKRAEVQRGHVAIKGFSGWLLKGRIELGYLLAVLTPLRAVRTWLRGLWVFVLNHRLG